jgi:hypothetical protein
LEFLVFNNMWRFSWIALWLALTLVLAGCGGASPASFAGSGPLSPVTIALSPQSMAITTGAQQAFTATVTNSSMTSVSWLVNGIAGGNSAVGTIDKTGNYTAPPYVPIPASVTVTAVANADESKTASASVSISGQSAPGTVTLSPKSASIYVGGTALFTATVSGSNPAVSWLVNGETGGNSSVGTITPVPGTGDQATYTAPLQVPDAGLVTVTAVSVANPQEAASAVVTVSPPIQGGAVVTIASPQNPPTVQAGETQPVQASVTGVSDTTVSWEVDGIAGGNANVGTIAAGTKDTAIYTAPHALPTPPEVQVTAVSNAQPSAAASIAVNLIPVQYVTVTVSADSCTNTSAVSIGSTVQFSATVTGNSNQSVTWQVNQVDGGNGQVGTISTGGIYTAPVNVPTPATVTVSAVSNAVPSVVGNQKITIASSPVLQVVLAPVPPLQPNYPDIPTGYGQSFQATVFGAGDISQAEVIWLENGYTDGDGGIYGTITPADPQGCVTIVSYTAPSSVPVPAQFPITAQSAYDSTKSASAVITIVPAPQITVTVDPNPANVPQTQQQPFNAIIEGTSDPNAFWSLSSQQCNGAACGTLSTPGPSPTTTYTAPAQGTPVVTLTAVSEANSSAHGIAIITVSCGGSPSISIFPSSATTKAGSASPLSFSAVINPCGNQSASVNWELGCISLWDGDAGENCNDQDFDGDGPGCTQINNGFKVCGNRSNVGPGNDPLSYYAPRNLFTNTFAPNVCETQNNGSGDGMVPLTATVSLQGCPQQGCQATACITITPP